MIVRTLLLADQLQLYSSLEASALGDQEMAGNFLMSVQNLVLYLRGCDG